MRALIATNEPFDGHVGIDLRRREPSVTEQFLDATQISTTFQQVRCCTVAKTVRSKIGRTLDLGYSRVHYRTNDSRIDAPPPDAKKDRRTHQHLSRLHDDYDEYVCQLLQLCM